MYLIFDKLIVNLTHDLTYCFSFLLTSYNDIMEIHNDSYIKTAL